MKIEEIELTEEHKGALVTYIKDTNNVEEGVISSWNDTYVFVKYYSDYPPFELQHTSKATYPRDLVFGSSRRLLKGKTD